MSETFQYDHLDRLTSSQVNGLSALSLTYSGNGNIASKADLGSYIYNPVKKNAVDSIINDPLATQPTFQQLVSYTSFNKAHTIEDESNGYDYQIIYGPDNQRVKSILSDSLGWERTRYYFGSYEKDSTSSGVKHTWYINSPYGLVAVYVKENTTETLYYAETDHLGSLVALRNTNGTVVESYSYDPWGRRRNPSNWSYSNVPEPVITNRGFTGHEHLDKFNLIDMNGRVYDPVTAGFLSPDPFVTNPYFSQSYNSYSYCVNNPLKFTDPSGYVYAQTMNETHIGGSYYYRGTQRTWDNELGGYIDENGYVYYIHDSDNPYSLNVPGIEGGASSDGYIYSEYHYSSMCKVDAYGIFEEVYRIEEYYNYYIFYNDVFSRISGPAWRLDAAGQRGGWLDPTGKAVAGLGLAAKGREILEWEYLRQAKINRVLSGNFSQPINNSLRGLKSSGRALGGAGIVLTGIDMGVNGINVSNGLDLVMGGVAFIPVAGWAISGIYFLSNMATQLITGESIGEHIQGTFTDSNASWKPW